MGWLIFGIFIVVPLLEIFAFIQVGSVVGALPTLALIVLTAVMGALLVRWQGLKVAMDARQTLARDELPVAAVVHGVLLLFAGLLLLTPGFVTDTSGFLLLVPGLRSLLAPAVSRPRSPTSCRRCVCGCSTAGAPWSQTGRWLPARRSKRRCAISKSSTA